MDTKPQHGHINKTNQQKVTKYKHPIVLNFKLSWEGTSSILKFLFLECLLLCQLPKPIFVMASFVKRPKSFYRLSHHRLCFLLQAPYLQHPSQWVKILSYRWQDLFPPPASQTFLIIVTMRITDVISFIFWIVKQSLSVSGLHWREVEVQNNTRGEGLKIPLENNLMFSKSEKPFNLSTAITF